MGQIKTSDLNLAATMSLNYGLKVARLEEDTKNMAKKWFVFESDKYTNEELNEMSKSYFNGELMVEPRSLAVKIAIFKNMLYSVKQ